MKQDVAEKLATLIEPLTFVTGDSDMVLAMPISTPDGKTMIERRFTPGGALCELYRQETGEGEWEDTQVCSTQYSLFVLPSGQKEAQFIPQKVADWAGTTRAPLVDDSWSLVGRPMYRTIRKDRLLEALKAPETIE